MNAADLPPTNGDNPDWDSGTAELGHILKPGQLDLSHKVILYLEDITVSFDGFRALNKLSLAIDAGELRCIIGPNGAGKTTMMDVITGKTRPDEGTVFFGQTIDLTRLSEPEIAHIGIGRKFQKPTIFENHTVFENLELAQSVRDPRFGGWRPHRRDAAADPPGERSRSPRRPAVARAEAVARDRHAADAGAEAAAAGRTGSRHDRRGDRAHR
jgi:urea transport system ATP-binding protein